MTRNAKMDPAHPFQRFPLAPHQTRDPRTRTEDTVVLCHLGVPRLDAAEWRLEIDGLVAHPFTLDFDDLRAYPRTELTSVHQCSGSPFAPFEPTRRVNNVSWTGARLADVLRDCRPSPAARFVWSYGADHGEFGGLHAAAYCKDLPIARVAADVLIAYAMNGAPLSPEHGFPARLVVPGFYGTNSVKWLTRITLAEGRATGPFTTRFYNDPVLDASGNETGETTPVWAIAPESILVEPEPRATLQHQVERELWGYAWADGGVARVDVRCSDDPTWYAAELAPARGREWQRFSFRWTPRHRGPALLEARAASFSGERQPLAGRRNAVHGVMVNVV